LVKGKQVVLFGTSACENQTVPQKGEGVKIKDPLNRVVRKENPAGEGLKGRLEMGDPPRNNLKGAEHRAAHGYRSKRGPLHDEKKAGNLGRKSWGT